MNSVYSNITLHNISSLLLSFQHKFHKKNSFFKLVNRPVSGSFAGGKNGGKALLECKIALFNLKLNIKRGGGTCPVPPPPNLL